MGLPGAAVIASGDPATRTAVRSAVLERFTRLIAGTERMSGWPWLRTPISSPCCGDRTRKPRLGVEGVS